MRDAFPIIVNNLESWSLGFLCGWVVCTASYRLWHGHRCPSPHREKEPRVTAERRYTLLGGVVTLVVAASIAGLVYVADNYTDGAHELWNACRHINYPLGCLVAVGVTYRIVLMAFDRDRWTDARSVHLVLWFGYIAANLLAAAMTSRHYDLVGVDATWVSGFRTVLMLGGLALTIWWPHPEKLTPIEERSR